MRSAIRPRGRGGPSRRRTRGRRADGPGDEGFTLVELAITLAVMAVIIVTVTPVVQVFYDESLAVQRTYNGADEALLTSEIMTRYIREMVEPAPPSGTGVPTPPFTTATGCSATFYADTGNPNGPQRVVAQASPCTGTHHTFLMSVTAPDPNSCPVTGSTGTMCTYTTNAPRFAVDIPNMINNTTPVFTYTLQGGSTTATPGSTCTSADGWSCTTPGTTCAVGAGNCQLDEVIAVSVNIQVDLAPGSPSGFQTLAYVIAPAYSEGGG
ncbi:MAG TPA: prepilin-type N-terminal cleavage/methylation domain-containing protein [Acidimicrobiales bacterium]|nr:prepilin-type N-terminal cleavage/methylation domain-containing protein [Acidimicrobiales bacterium]